MGEDWPEAGGEGGAKGECHESTEWKESVEENPESDPATVDVRKGDLVRCLDGGLITSERSGGAVIDLLQLCKACGRVCFSGSKIIDWMAGCSLLRGVMWLSSVASLKVSLSSRSQNLFDVDSSTSSTKEDGTEVFPGCGISRLSIVSEGSGISIGTDLSRGSCISRGSCVIGAAAAFSNDTSDQLVALFRRTASFGTNGKLSGSSASSGSTSDTDFVITRLSFCCLKGELGTDSISVIEGVSDSRRASVNSPLLSFDKGDRGDRGERGDRGDV